MKKKLIITIVSIIVVCGTAFAVVGMRRGRSKEKPDRIEVVRRGPFVVKLHETGNLEPLIKVEVRSNVEGEIEKLYVDEGSDVVKGQKLLKIDPNAKAIVSSGYSSSPVLADFSSYGFKGVIAKPYKVHELINTIKRVMKI